MNEVDRIQSALNFVPVGGHDERVQVAFALFDGAGHAGFSLFDNWYKRRGDAYDAAESKSVWKSAQKPGGKKVASLFYSAMQNGWKDPSKSRSKPSPALPLAAPKQTPQKPVRQASNAAAVWERCIPATPGEPYIYRKQGTPDGLRVYPASAPPLVIRGQNVKGYLVVPCWDGDKLQTLQFIPMDKGGKLNLPGASFGDGFFTVGDLANAQRVFVVEGISQGWAVNRATGAAAVVCFGAGRMATVAKILRDRHAAASLVVVPDRGKEEQAAKIAADIFGQWVAMPADKPANYDANDLMLEQGADALRGLLERPQAPAMRYKLQSADDLCNAPPMRWLVRGVLPVDGLAALYGASGSGKSFLILDMGCAIASGDAEWFGRRVTQAPVTYVCLEGEAGLGKRVKAWKLHHSKPLPDALRFITQPFDLLSDDVCDLARAVLAGGGAGGMVILDTLNRAAPGADENSSVDMGNLIAAAKELQSLIGGLVLLVHHTGKDTTKGLRGHSSLYAALDAAIEVTATDTRKAWSVAKSKDDITGEAHPFKLHIVPVGCDDEGDPITSCVIEPDESTQAIQKKMPTLGSNQGIAHKALGEPLRKSPHSGKDGAPAGRPCVSFDDALSIVAPLMPTETKHQKERAKEAIAGLVRRGIMGMKGEWLWDI